MTDITRETLADRIANSGARLKKLLEFQAPEIVIEGERALLLKFLIDFPVNAEAQEMFRQARIRNDEQEHKFLEAHGFYDDVLKS